MSRVKHSFKYTWPDGVLPIYLHEWVETLPESQKKEFYDAQKRQLAFRESKVQDGALEVKNNEYVWRNESAAEVNKPYDETWRLYFERYLQETQTRFEIVEEKIDGE